MKARVGRLRAPLVVGHLVVALALVGCPTGEGTVDDGGSPGGDGDGDGDADGGAGFSLSSSAFVDGAALPVRFTCQGENLSPPLSWTAPPEGTAGFGLVFTDLSIGLIHSTLWDLPGDVRSLPEGVPEGYTVDELGGAHQSAGYNGTTRGYLGPCPPNEHTYRFTLYAVGARPLAGLDEGSTRDDVKATLETAALAEASLTVTFDPG